MSAEMITKCHQHNESTTPPLHDDIKKSGEKWGIKIVKIYKVQIVTRYMQKENEFKW